MICFSWQLAALKCDDVITRRKEGRKEVGWVGGGQRLSTILGQATYNIYLLGGCIGYLPYYAMGPSYLLGGVGWVVRTVLSTVSFTLTSLFTVRVTGHAMNNGSGLHL